MEYIVMKPNEKQKKICELIKSTASYWMNSNDIDSPTHVNDIEEEVYSLGDDIDLDDFEKEIIISYLLNMYWVVKNIEIKNMTHKGIKCSECPFKYDKYPDCLHSFITKYGSDCTLINKLKQEKKQ